MTGGPRSPNPTVRIHRRPQNVSDTQLARLGVTRPRSGMTSVVTVRGSVSFGVHGILM